MDRQLLRDQGEIKERLDKIDRENHKRVVRDKFRHIWMKKRLAILSGKDNHGFLTYLFRSVTGLNIVVKAHRRVPIDDVVIGVENQADVSYNKLEFTDFI